MFAPEKLHLRGLASLSMFDSDDDAAMCEDDVRQLMTPCGKQTTTPLPILDEDSGLGMEMDQVKPPCQDPIGDANDSFSLLVRPFAEVSFAEEEERDVRRPLFARRKRLLLAEDQGSYSKRRREGRSPRKSLMKKSLSFGDSPLAARVEESVVKSAVSRLVEQRNLIGDGSTSFSLPVIPGKHSDLKSVTCHTVADLLQGKYDDVIGSFQLIDCRYPYEYDGGHVMTAVNIHRKEEEQVESLLRSRDGAPDDGRRHIIVFYCEFSSERGPRMCRTFRRMDRDLNKDNYPHLNFPEIYVMHNGYKEFYETHKELCAPQDYTPMLHKDHSDDLRHFRSKSKSWSNGDKCRKRAMRLF